MPLVLAAAGLGALLFIPWAGLMTGFQAIYTTLWDLPFVAGNDALWTSLNPGIVIFLALLLSWFLLVLVLFNKTAPALLLVGAGILLIATGLIAIAIEPVRMSAWGFGLAFALISVGEVVAAPALISRIGGDVHWRLTTLFVALWLATSGSGHWVMGLLTGAGVQNPFGLPLAFAIISVPIALVLLVVAIPLQRRLFDPPDSRKGRG
jgi:dipeptide/tripeptide permease